MTEAEQDLVRAVELEPDSRDLRFARARLFLERGDDRRALADVTAALERFPQDLSPFGSRGQILHEFAHNAPFYAALRRARPDDPLVHYTHGAALAARRRWAEAAAAYRAGGEPPFNTDHAFVYAAVLLLSGDHAAYARYARKIAQAAGTDPGHYPKYLAARILGLAAHPPVPAEVHLGLAEAASKADPDPAWFSFGLALAQLRSGDPSRSFQALEDPRIRNWQPGLAELARALALEQLGQQAEARSELVRAGTDLKTRTILRPGGQTYTGITDWIEAEVLRREAERTILDPGFPEDPFAHLAEIAPAP